MYSNNRKKEINNKGEFEMLELKEKKSWKKIRCLISCIM
ncbi:hypothetical protein B4080_6292 [Bacillus cereus]|nr:hypothetical protein B4080_6292 [Bacillus cereus]